MSNDVSAFAESSLTATIKFGSGFEAPWLVVRGDNARAELVKAFDMKIDDDVDLAGVIAEASRLAQALWAAADGLGAKSMGKARSTAKKSAQKPAKGAAADKPQAKASKGSEEPPFEPDGAPEGGLSEEIEACASKKALARLWQKNKAAFDADPKLLEQWKAKGKELSE